MINWIKKLFGGKKEDDDEIHSITCGEPDENGFCDTYVNGEKSNVRMLVWTKEQVEKLHKITDEIYKKHDSEREQMIEQYGKRCWERFERSGLSFHQFFNPYDLNRNGGCKKHRKK